jgi:hypothetical protein
MLKLWHLRAATAAAIAYELVTISLLTDCGAFRHNQF